MTPKKLPPPTPLIAPGKPVEWLFAFKFNAAFAVEFPEDEQGSDLEVRPLFDKDDPSEEARHHKTFAGKHCQQYVFATNESPTLAKGAGCLGATEGWNDPLAATFGNVYRTEGYYYVVWNDQFKGHPIDNKMSPWGHSKGMLAWNEDGEGMVLQVSTPSWPASGSQGHPRVGDGNTLGYVDDDDIEVSQHFFALKLSKADLVAVLGGLRNASVVTDQKKAELVRNGGPEDIQALVKTLGVESASNDVLLVELDSGVKLVSKPSHLPVPSWQLVSAILGGVDLRVASWWMKPEIPSTPAGEVPGCWSSSIHLKPGKVEIATSGTWENAKLGFLGGPHPNANHAKVAVSMDPGTPLSIFGDMNQQGALCGDKEACKNSQNGRGGLFFAVSDVHLWKSVSSLLRGDTDQGASATSAPRT